MAFSDKCVLVNYLSGNGKNILEKLFTQNVGYNQNYQTYEHK